MDLKEYIKSLVREMLEEEGEGGAVGNTTAAVPDYLTSRAFSKGKGENAATKTAKKQGFKVTKGETEMPADSKVKDYVSLTGKKKKKTKIYELGREDVDTEFLVTTKDGKKIKATYKGIRRDGELMFDPGVNVGEIITIHPDDIDIKVKKLQESDYDKASPSSNPSLYSQASGYTGPSLSSKGDGYYKKESMQESLQNIIKEELLNEVTYNKFKNEVKFRTKNEQLHKAIREVKRKLSEIDRIVEYTSRMKQELSEGEEGVRYWKATQKNVATISEMVNQLNNKIKNLQQ
jgi:hypothetical protein